MTEKTIRQADLDAQRDSLKLYVEQEFQKREKKSADFRWRLLLLFSPPIFGAFVKFFEIIRGITERMAIN